MVFIYILKLTKGKYYVGKTSNPRFRLLNHFNSNGSSWTNIYKPVKLLELIPECDDYDEDKYTQIYMSSYGIENVRGGSYVKVELDRTQKDFLIKEIRGATNKCNRCGRNGHFVKDCYASTIIDQSDTESENEVCFRCGRDTHYANNCYASRDVNGNFLK
jgi:hypothetical protein